MAIRHQCAERITLPWLEPPPSKSMPPPMPAFSCRRRWPSGPHPVDSPFAACGPTPTPPGHSQTPKVAPPPPIAPLPTPQNRILKLQKSHPQKQQPRLHSSFPCKHNHLPKSQDFHSDARSSRHPKKIQKPIFGRPTQRVDFTQFNLVQKWPIFGRRLILTEKERGGGQKMGNFGQNGGWGVRNVGQGCRGVCRVTVENVEEFYSQKNRHSGRCFCRRFP